MMNVEINKNVKLSEHFTLAEMTKTSERQEHLGTLRRAAGRQSQEGRLLKGKEVQLSEVKNNHRLRR